MKHRVHVLLAIATIAIVAGSHPVSGQTKPVAGIRQNTPDVHAFKNARIIIAPGKVIDKATLVIRNGIIKAVGPSVNIPPDARVWDLSGLTVYPGFIDSYSDLGEPKKQQGGSGQMRGGGQQPQQESRGEKHWSDNVLASQNADELFAPDAKAAEKLRGMGFTAIHTVPQVGIFRGTSAVVALGDGTPNQLVLASHVAHDVTFESSRDDDFPNSLMGTIALIRQTFYDAKWYKEAMAVAAKNPGEARPEIVKDLASLDDVVMGKQPVIFESTDEMSVLRAAKIAKEFSIRYWVRGSGYEYRRLHAIKQTGAPIILPLNFPEAPAVQTPEEAIDVTLRDLRHWDEAPENPGRLLAAGVDFVLTTALLKDPGTFTANLRKAIDRGLPATAALAALTVKPAKLLGIDTKVGTLEVGKDADFVISDGEPLAEKSRVLETWIDGQRYEVKPKPEIDPRGTWTAVLSGAPFDTLTIQLKGEAEAVQGSGKAKGVDIKFSSITYSDRRINFSFNADSAGVKGVMCFSGSLTADAFMGTGELPDGTTFAWKASRKEPFKAEPDTSKPKPATMSTLTPLYPPGPFGRTAYPEQPNYLLIKNATIWTCSSQGIIDGGDILVEKGRILKVGSHIEAPKDAVTVDGTGMHVTPGLIDCHSHTGVAGSVNEGSQSVTAEVRIGDVLDPDDISLYRELAGGLTVANVLHGSANAIGGQNQVIKLRWGSLPEDMKFEGAIPGIKFALGENPKQSNWGDRYTSRYPQTREGVEQIIRDEFRAAQDYERAMKEYAAGTRKIPVRKDLELDAIVEILKGQRVVHSHSYRQDEILMLTRVAEDFGFKIAAFQHVLEGYKVADALARDGIGASTFSDWWAYKFEVYDAIPYNGALMHDAGVVVSFNSDSDELARHLNTEAAKAVKYGGVSQEEALKFVTLNPAKQLQIDKRVGSIEIGKDADFVLWDGSPLSVYSACQQTWIDGRKFFDRTEDRRMNEDIRKQRAMLIQKILGLKEVVGEKKPSQKMPKLGVGDEKEGQ